MAMMKCVDDIKPIAPILKRMEVLDIVTYPIDRMMSVYMTASRLHKEFKDEGRRFRVEPDGKKVIVQRMK